MSSKKFISDKMDRLKVPIIHVSAIQDAKNKVSSDQLTSNEYPRGTASGLMLSHKRRGQQNADPGFSNSTIVPI